MKIFVDHSEHLPEPPSANERLKVSIDYCYQMRSQWDLKLMEVVAEVERRQLYLEDGQLSTADWLAARLNIGHKRAQEFVTVACCLGELPKIKAAYAQGELSYDHLRALTKIANEDNEADLLDVCLGKSVRDAWKLVDAVLAVSKEDFMICRSDRFLEFRDDHESRSTLMLGLFPEEEGAIVKKAINSLAKKMPKDPGPLDPSDQKLPLEKRRADALVALVSSSEQGRSKHPLVVLYATANTVAKGEGVAEIEEGPLVNGETARRLACDCSYYVVTEDTEGNPIGVGRKTRSVPEKLAREVLRRDKHCRYPGCNQLIGVANHHIEHWGEGGPTELNNLVLFCPSHHGFVHEGGFVVKGVPPDIWIEKPKREAIKFGPPRLTSEAKAEFEDEVAKFEERAGPPPDG